MKSKNSRAFGNWKRFAVSAVCLFFVADTALAISPPIVRPYAGNSGSVVEPVPFSDVTEGELVIFEPQPGNPDLSSVQSAIPLEKTVVEAEVSGFVGRTVVTQRFRNPRTAPIEAVYRFPLPHGASVDSMRIRIGERTVVGKIEKREEAERQYAQAVLEGRTAALLNQERPNLFTQKVGNILPGETIEVKISYFETLAYDAGKYRYVFPMVAGPRFSPQTVADAANLDSPSMPAGTRDGHSIELSLTVDAGVPIGNFKSASHTVEVRKISESSARITVAKADNLPNKDFSLEYGVASDAEQFGILTHKDANGKEGYFTLMAEPPKAPSADQVRDKEIVFVLDTSGSMQGRPIETVKKAMRKAIANLGPNDAFDVIQFNNGSRSLFGGRARAADAEGKRSGLEFVDSLQAGGGTMMLAPFASALESDDGSGDRMRIILGMTDGDVGNESELLRLLSKELGNNRVFMFGVDAAANRYLIDNMAAAGRGKATYVLRDDDPEAKVDEFYASFASPILTDVRIDWDGLAVSDVLPKAIPDLYAGQPIAVTGKYSAEGWFGKLDTVRKIKITGKIWNRPYERIVEANFKSAEPANSALSGLWAKKKVDSLYWENRFEPDPKLKEEVTALGLAHSIMTEFTSFVAVDSEKRTEGAPSETIQVPVYEVEGKDMYRNAPMPSYAPSANALFGSNAGNVNRSADVSYGLSAGESLINSKMAAVDSSGLSERTHRLGNPAPAIAFFGLFFAIAFFFFRLAAFRRKKATADPLVENISENPERP